MKFRGNLSTIKLKSAFLKILQNRLTGVLKINSKEMGEVALFYKEGEITHFHSRNLIEIHWPKILFAKGDLSKEDFNTIKSQGIKDLTGVISSQMISEEKALIVFKQIVEKEIYSLFLILEGEFNFEPVAEVPSVFKYLQLFKKTKFNTKLLLDESVRRGVGGTDVGGLNRNEIFDKLPDKDKAIQDKLNKDELKVFSLIDGVKTVFEILKEMGSNNQNVGIVIKKLIDLKAIKLSNTNDLLAKALKLSSNKNFESAAKIYLLLSETEKSNLSHRELLADTYLKINQTDKAIVQLEQISQKYISLKNFKKANEGLQKILELDSTKLVIHELIASNYMEMGQKAEAIEELKLLLSAYINNGFIEKAKNIYLKTIKIDPEDIEVMALMSKTYSNSGDRYEAVEIWNKMSLIYINRSMDDEAIEILTKVVKITPKDEEAKERLHSLLSKKNYASRTRKIALVLVGILAICLLYVFGPQSYNQAFPGTPTFDQEVERCRLISQWLKKKNINEISIYGMSDTLTTVLKKEGLKVSTSPTLNLGMKSGGIIGKASAAQIKAIIINEELKDVPMEALQKYFEAGGVIYFRGFNNKLSENEPLCVSILSFLKKGQICVVLPKFPEVDIRNLSLKKRVLSENIFVDEKNADEFEKWHNKILKNKLEKDKRK